MARHVPTEEQRNQVTVMAGLGTSPSIIAGKIGISEATLAKVYARELRDGPELVKLEGLKQLLASAQSDEGAGRITAIARLLELIGGGKPGARSDDPRLRQGCLAVQRDDGSVVFRGPQLEVLEEVFRIAGVPFLMISQDDAAL